uniref:Uncharacterized protein n=1 Tax=Rhizophora mucronata TaxID=61149 RepID=A0A2P2PT48_RHIMU
MLNRSNICILQDLARQSNYWTYKIGSDCPSRVPRHQLGQTFQCFQIRMLVLIECQNMKSKGGDLAKIAGVYVYEIVTVMHKREDLKD